MNWDDYFYSDSDVLKNKLNIRNNEKLHEAEAESVESKALTLPKVSSDLEGLKQIHEHFFSDVYEWAGEFREVGMRKEGKPFLPPDQIESTCQDIMTRLEKNDFLQGLDQDEFSKSAAHLLGEINAAHPFREGNGRTQRAFVSQIAEKAGYQLDFSNITAERNIQASIEFSEGQPEKMERMVAEAVDPKQSEIAKEFNDFLRPNVGKESWNNLYISTATEGQTYDGTFIGSADKGFAFQLSNNDIVVASNDFLPEGELRSGDHISVSIPVKESDTQISKAAFIEEGHREIMASMPEAQHEMLKQAFTKQIDEMSESEFQALLEEKSEDREEGKSKDQDLEV